jgi:hypothetical protein
MRTHSLGNAIERVLELSADAQIKRRNAVKDSQAFHAFTAAIAAYGKVLAALTSLRQEHEEVCLTLGLFNSFATELEPHTAV